jgi:hypothetical protein
LDFPEQLNPVKERRLVNPGKNKKQRNDMHSTIDPHVNILSQRHYRADAITAKPKD